MMASEHVDSAIFLYGGRNLNVRIHYLALIIPAILGPLLGQALPQTGDWPAYGRDPGAVRFSPLDQINTTNVSQLQRAWTYQR
jgi:hypothetical protein